MILLYCCLFAEKEKDEERGNSAQEIVATQSRRSFAQRWQSKSIPAAVLRKPPAVVSKSSSTANMSYDTIMNHDSTSMQPYQQKDTSTYY